MKINRIEPIAVRMPLTKPVTMAGVELITADNLIVRMESDTGGVGWGEAASAPIMTGETVASMVAAVRHLRPYVEGCAAGYVAYKIKVGVNTPEIYAERTRRVRETLGTGFLISSAAN